MCPLLANAVGLSIRALWSLSAPTPLTDFKSTLVADCDDRVGLLLPSFGLLGESQPPPFT